jgi:hypothetical protein
VSDPAMDTILAAGLNHVPEYSLPAAIRRNIPDPSQPLEGLK